MLVDSTLDILGKQNGEKINVCTSTTGYPCIVPTNASPPNDMSNTAFLKKKGGQNDKLEMKKYLAR